jgi:hypothetical protein
MLQHYRGVDKSLARPGSKQATATEDFEESFFKVVMLRNYRGADKSLARPGRKQATATEDFDVYISYLLS